MLRYALVFFVVAIIAALFGFGGIAAGATEIAKHPLLRLRRAVRRLAGRRPHSPRALNDERPGQCRGRREARRDVLRADGEPRIRHREPASGQCRDVVRGSPASGSCTTLRETRRCPVTELPRRRGGEFTASGRAAAGGRPGGTVAGRLQPLLRRASRLSPDRPPCASIRRKLPAAASACTTASVLRLRRRRTRPNSCSMSTRRATRARSSASEYVRSVTPWRGVTLSEDRSHAQPDSRSSTATSGTIAVRYAAMVADRRIGSWTPTDIVAAPPRHSGACAHVALRCIPAATARPTSSQQQAWDRFGSLPRGLRAGVRGARLGVPSISSSRSGVSCSQHLGRRHAARRCRRVPRLRAHDDRAVPGAQLSGALRDRRRLRRRSRRSGRPTSTPTWRSYVGDAWYVFDPTGISPVTGPACASAPGRDAADVSFATIFGPVRSGVPRIAIRAGRSSRRRASTLPGADGPGRVDGGLRTFRLHLRSRAGRPRAARGRAEWTARSIGAALGRRAIEKSPCSARTRWRMPVMPCDSWLFCASIGDADAVVLDQQRQQCRRPCRARRST